MFAGTSDRLSFEHRNLVRIEVCSPSIYRFKSKKKNARPFGLRWRTIYKVVFLNQLSSGLRKMYEYVIIIFLLLT